MSLLMTYVSKETKIRNWYNQVYLTQDTTRESDKNPIREPRGYPFPSRWPQGYNEQTGKDEKPET